jgi:hypothetical protein
VVAPIAVAGIITWWKPVRWPTWVAAGFIVVISISTSAMIQQFMHDGRLIGDRLQDWRGAVDFVNHRRTGGREAALVRSGLIESDRLREPHDGFLVEYCLSPVKSLYVLDVEAIPLPSTDSSRFEADVWHRLVKLDSIWFVVNGSQKVHLVFEDDLRRQIGSTFSLALRREFGEILVLQFMRSMGEDGAEVIPGVYLLVKEAEQLDTVGFGPGSCR